MSDVDRLTEIANEMMGLIGASDIFGFLDETTGDMWKVDQRLQEIMQGRQAFDTIELAMYLRTCGTREAYLPTWRPLLNAAVEMGKMRGEPVDDIFFGLMERQPDPARNTGYPK
jgi:hypothetical protein